jgi:hypothetical protein
VGGGAGIGHQLAEDPDTLPWLRERATSELNEEVRQAAVLGIGHRLAGGSRHLALAARARYHQL